MPRKYRYKDEAEFQNHISRLDQTYSRLRTQTLDQKDVTKMRNVYNNFEDSQTKLPILKRILTELSLGHLLLCGAALGHQAIQRCAEVMAKRLLEKLRGFDLNSELQKHASDLLLDTRGYFVTSLALVPARRAGNPLEMNRPEHQSLTDSTETATQTQLTILLQQRGLTMTVLESHLINSLREPSIREGSIAITTHGFIYDCWPEAIPSTLKALCERVPATDALPMEIQVGPEKVVTGLIDFASAVQVTDLIQLLWYVIDGQTPNGLRLVCPNLDVGFLHIVAPGRTVASIEHRYIRTIEFVDILNRQPGWSLRRGVEV